MEVIKELYELKKELYKKQIEKELLEMEEKIRLSKTTLNEVFDMIYWDVLKERSKCIKPNQIIKIYNGESYALFDKLKKEKEKCKVDEDGYMLISVEYDRNFSHCENIITATYQLKC